MLISMIGRCLRHLRAGEKRLVWNHPALASVPESIELRSSAFGDGETIPLRYCGTGLGENISPPLAWHGVPKDAASLLLLVQDHDGPVPSAVLHLVAACEVSAEGELPEGVLNAPGGEGVLLGEGAFKHVGWVGPWPLPGHGPHHYVFQLFALARPLPKLRGLGRKGLFQLLDGNVIARGRMTGVREQL